MRAQTEAMIAHSAPVEGALVIGPWLCGILHAKFREHTSLLKKSLSGRSEVQNKAKTPQNVVLSP